MQCQDEVRDEGGYLHLLVTQTVLWGDMLILSCYTIEGSLDNVYPSPKKKGLKVVPRHILPLGGMC